MWLTTQICADFGEPNVTAVTDIFAWALAVRPWYGLMYSTNSSDLRWLEPFGEPNETAVTDILAWALAVRPWYGLMYATDH